MILNIIDVGIGLLLLLGVVIGFKRGAIKTTVSFVGLVIAIIGAALLKNPLSSFMYNVLPFFNFNGLFKGVTVLNILLYEIIAFFIVLSVLLIVVKCLTFIADVIEKLLKFTIILALPSKIIGMVLGFIIHYIYVFVILYIVSLSMFNIAIINESKLTPKILNNTPLLSNIAGGTFNAATDIFNLSKEYNAKSSEEFNKDSLDILLKYKVTNINTIDKLIKNGKLKINGSNEILNKYR